MWPGLVMKDGDESNDREQSNLEQGLVLFFDRLSLLKLDNRGDVSKDLTCSFLSRFMLLFYVYTTFLLVLQTSQVMMIPIITLNTNFYQMAQQSHGKLLDGRSSGASPRPLMNLHQNPPTAMGQAL